VLDFRLSDMDFFDFLVRSISRFQEFFRSRFRKTFATKKLSVEQEIRIVILVVVALSRVLDYCWFPIAGASVRPFTCPYAPLKKARQYSSSLDVSTAWPVGCI
jgi:hypothetical protein